MPIIILPLIHEKASLVRGDSQEPESHCVREKSHCCTHRSPGSWVLPSLCCSGLTVPAPVSRCRCCCCYCCCCCSVTVAGSGCSLPAAVAAAAETADSAAAASSSPSS